MMTDPDLKPDHLTFLETIQAAGYRMLHMVNSSLDLIKMERGAYEFKPEPVDVVKIIRKIEEDLSPIYGPRGNRLTLKIRGEAALSEDEFAFMGEELLFYSLFSNLIKNAFEASPEGEDVTVELDEPRNGNCELGVIRVCNKGMVPEEIRDRFFEKYVTCGKSGGTGLGTYSARLIAETQHGDIFLESSNESGTAIVVRLPMAAPPSSRLEAVEQEASPEEMDVEAPSHAMDLLLVDDDPFNLQLLKTLLQGESFSMETAANGRRLLIKSGPRPLTRF